MAVPPLSAPPRVRALAQAVSAAGGRAFVSGGGVRDQLLALPVHDWDLEIYGLDERRLEAVIAGFGQVKKVGGRFGVYVLQGIELALPQGPGFRVAPDIPPSEACRRRDFSVNALLWDPLRDELVDFFGGVDDLRRRLLRHIDADTFVEDPLRALRCARLAGQLEFGIAPQSAALCRRLAPRMADLPWERIGKELSAWLLRGRDPAWTWDALVLTGAHCLFPEFQALQGCPQRPDAHPEGDAWIHTGRVLSVAGGLRNGDKGRDLVLMLSALLHDLGKADSTHRDARGIWRASGHESASVVKAEQFLQRWFRSPGLARQVLPLVRWHGAPFALNRDGAKAGAYRRLALQVPDPALLLDLARADAAGAGRTDLSALEKARAHWQAMGLLGERPLPWLRGDDLQHMGLAPGPLFKRLLDLAYRMQLSGRFADEAALKKRMRFLLGRLHLNAAPALKKVR